MHRYSGGSAAGIGQADNAGLYGKAVELMAYPACRITVKRFTGTWLPRDAGDENLRAIAVNVLISRYAPAAIALWLTPVFLTLGRNIWYLTSDQFLLCMCAEGRSTRARLNVVRPLPDAARARWTGTAARRRCRLVKPAYDAACQAFRKYPVCAMTSATLPGTWRDDLANCSTILVPLFLPPATLHLQRFAAVLHTPAAHIDIMTSGRLTLPVALIVGDSLRVATLAHFAARTQRRGKSGRAFALTSLYLRGSTVLLGRSSRSILLPLGLSLRGQTATWVDNKISLARTRDVAALTALPFWCGRWRDGGGSGGEAEWPLARRIHSYMVMASCCAASPPASLYLLLSRLAYRHFLVTRRGLMGKVRGCGRGYLLKHNIPAGVAAWRDSLGRLGEKGHSAYHAARCSWLHDSKHCWLQKKLEGNFNKCGTSVVAFLLHVLSR